MHSIQNNTNINFTANITGALQKELLKELRPDIGQKYLSRLSRRLERIPADVTIQDLEHTNKGTTFVRLNHSGDSKTFEVESNGNNLDVIEGLLEKDKSGTPKLSEFIYRLFGI